MASESPRQSSAGGKTEPSEDRAAGAGGGWGGGGDPEQTRAIPELETLNIAWQLSLPPPHISAPLGMRSPGISPVACREELFHSEISGRLQSPRLGHEEGEPWNSGHEDVALSLEGLLLFGSSAGSLGAGRVLLWT